ncbi:atrophin-1-like [Oncorhynchus tshawytscha]|uniref:atrophin-1-like n=1 Tax=Oncorhynchus tshawytscha TaxID=74940 RepID=UPI001C3E379D|nr:atrophin-1-like [Oncorhynchus tshawytscha]
MKTRTHKESMPMRSGRRRGGSNEERRGRRPHPSPSRAERNDRQTQRAAGEELAVSRFNHRSQGHDSSESEGEELVPPPKRQKVQDSSSVTNPPTSTHSTDSTPPTIPPPPSAPRQSRDSDNEDGQSQGSRSSVVGSLANSLSSGRDIDQDNRSSSPSLSASPPASLDSDSDGPDSPKQGEGEREKRKEGGVGKTGGEERRAAREGRGDESCGDGERKDGGIEDSPSLKLPSSSISSSAPVPSLRGAGDSANDSNSVRKSYFSQDSKLVSKMEYGPASADTVHSGNRMNSKAKAQCVTKATVAGGDYPLGNPNIPHPPPPPLPPPPALKPLELGGQNLPSEVKVEREKMEKGEKLMDNKTAPPSLLPQTSPLPPSQPPPHPHHYSPTGWQGGTATGCQGSWGYTRYSGNHHTHQPQHQPPVQQQQLPSVYNPPSSRHSSSSHPPYLPHPHKEYLPRYASGGGERERGAAGERGGVRVEYGGREIGNPSSSTSGLPAAPMLNRDPLPHPKTTPATLPYPHTHILKAPPNETTPHRWTRHRQGTVPPLDQNTSTESTLLGPRTIPLVAHPPPARPVSTPVLLE